MLEAVVEEVDVGTRTREELRNEEQHGEIAKKSHGSNREKQSGSAPSSCKYIFCASIYSAVYSLSGTKVSSHNEIKALNNVFPFGRLRNETNLCYQIFFLSSFYRGIVVTRAISDYNQTIRDKKLQTWMNEKTNTSHV